MVSHNKPDPWQEDYERQKAASQLADPQHRQNPGGRGRPRPNLLATWGRIGIGTFSGGLVAVIAAVIIHDHAAYPNSLCNTGLGELGQAISSTAQTDCGLAGLGESLVGWLVFLGVVGMVGGLAKMGVALAGGLPPAIQAPGLKRPRATSGQAAARSAATPAAAQQPYGSAPTSGPAGPARPAAWAPPPPPPGAPRPVVPVDPADPLRPAWPDGR
jgi:hypothetical protein